MNGKLEQIIKDIMEMGYVVAMCGSPFKSEEENIAESVKLYEETIEKYKQVILDYKIGG